MVLLRAIVDVIVLLDTFLRGAFMVFGAFSVLAKAAIRGVQDVEFPQMEIPSTATVAETILEKAATLIQGCFNLLFSLVWPAYYHQEAAAAREKVRAYAMYLVATFRPRNTLPATPTWPSITLLDSKAIQRPIIHRRLLHSFSCILHHEIISRCGRIQLSRTHRRRSS